MLNASVPNDYDAGLVKADVTSPRITPSLNQKIKRSLTIQSEICDRMARGRRAVPIYRGDAAFIDMFSVSDGNRTQPSQDDVESLSQNNFGVSRNFVTPPLNYSPFYHHTHDLSSTIRSSIDRMTEIEHMEKRQREVYKLLKSRLWYTSDQQHLQSYPTTTNFD